MRGLRNGWPAPSRSLGLFARVDITRGNINLLKHWDFLPGAPLTEALIE